jgi:hypothetical protein
MNPKHDNFRSVKDATFDAILPPKADSNRVGLIAAGNPDVLREAMGLADYAHPKRKRGGRVKHLDAMTGARSRHRLDRRRRRASGGSADDADSEQPAQTTAPAAPPSSTSWLPPRAQAMGLGASAINRGAEAVGRGVAAGLMALDKAGHELTGSRSAYRRGGSARR